MVQLCLDGQLQRVDEKWAWESLCYDGRRDLPTGEEEVTYGHFRRLPLTSLNRRNTDFKKQGNAKANERNTYKAK